MTDLISALIVGTIVMMAVLSWNLFVLALITGPLAFGTAKIYGDLMAVNTRLVFSFQMKEFSSL